MQSNKLKIMLIGPLPPPIGGISVSFKILVELLKKRNDINIEIVDFNDIRNRHNSSLKILLIFCYNIFQKIRTVDILTVYFASTALATVGLILLLFSFIFNKPLIIRKAAGFDYLNLGFLKGRIADFVIKHSSLYLAETKNLVLLARKRNIKHVEWYPTNRPMPSDIKTDELNLKTCRRFVFVGQVRAHKGINEIIQASEMFKDDITVHIYGPLFDDLPKNIFENNKKVEYKGILSTDNVVPVLKNYDAFLLPSKANTEGYPGAIFEAYSAGLPIITTKCGAIPEIVDQTSGIFVEPGNSSSLYYAMKVMYENKDLYHKLIYGVIEKRKKFDSSVWTERFIEYCWSAVLKHKHIPSVLL